MWSDVSMVRRLWVMTMNWLWSASLLDGLHEAPHVRLVEHGVHLVQDAEGGGPRLEEGEEQRYRRQRPLAAGQHR